MSPSEQSNRPNNTHGRYHIGDGETLLATAKRREEAMRAAQRIANSTGAQVEVFDSMARHGGPELWTLHPGAADPDGPCLVIPPTRRRS